MAASMKKKRNVFCDSTKQDQIQFNAILGEYQRIQLNAILKQIISST